MKVTIDDTNQFSFLRYIAWYNTVNSVFKHCPNIFPSGTATLMNKGKLATVTRESQEKRPRSNQSLVATVLRIRADFITQVSEEIEGGVTKKLCEKFTGTENQTLGALSKLDEFLLNSKVREQSGTVPGTYRNSDKENQEPNEDIYQNDSHPEVSSSVNRSPQSDFGTRRGTLHPLTCESTEKPKFCYCRQKLWEMSSMTPEWQILLVRIAHFFHPSKW